MKFVTTGSRTVLFDTCCGGSNVMLTFILLILFFVNSAAVYRQVRQATTTTSKSEKMTTHYEMEERGTLHTLDYRVYFKGPNGYISPWHDIPLFADADKKIFNFIVEIPRWTNAKMEMGVKFPLNPIRQDDKKGEVRFVNNFFPYKGYIWNYGAFPQTWEDPSHIDPDTKAKGDNDPLDVCEIGSKIHSRGQIVQVKVLGTLALVDEGETDWKIFTIDVTDPLAEKLNDIDDVEKHMPGLLKASVEWFRIYKIPAGEPANTFAFNGQFKNRDYALKVIAETNGYWKKLIMRTDAEGYALKWANVAENAARNTDQSELAKIVAESAKPAPAKPIPAEVDVWHFISE